MATIEELLSEAKKIRSGFRQARDAKTRRNLEARYRDIDRQLAELRTSQAGLTALGDSRSENETGAMTGAQSSGEIEVYYDNDIRVTSARIIVGGKTYALRNVASVSMQEHPAVDETASFRTLGTLLTGVGAIIILLILQMLVEGRGAARGTLTGFVTVALVCIGLGGWLLSAKNTAKPTYSIVISSSSGEVQALTSPDRGQIEKALASINEAIVRYL